MFEKQYEEYRQENKEIVCKNKENLLERVATLDVAKQSRERCL